MRRDLIQFNNISPDKELLLTKLVLSYKSKSNEAFSHRRWIVQRSMKLINNSAHDMEHVLGRELQISQFAAERAKNNYHAWNHRIWLMENFLKDLGCSLLLCELEFSFTWISRNVSDHSGYHYRQRILSYIREYRAPLSYFFKYDNYVTNLLNISSSESILSNLLGYYPTESQKDAYEAYLCVLLHEATTVLTELNENFPGHESLWYHRRFVVHSLLTIVYEYLGVKKKYVVNFNHIKIGNDSNIMNVDVVSSVDTRIESSGVKSPKIFKPELTTSESCALYKMLIKLESEFVSSEYSKHFNEVQLELVRRHEKWLKCVLCLDYFYDLS